MTSTPLSPAALMQRPAAPVTVRLVSYNIMTGGEGRADPIAEVVLGRRADIVGIHEADDRDVLRRLAWRWKMDFVLAEAADGWTALFSRFPIVDTSNRSLLLRTPMPILDATVNVAPAGASVRQELTVRVARLTQPSEADRMATRLGSGHRRQPMVMLMSYEPPLGQRVVDGELMRSMNAIPNRTRDPVRQIDDVLVRPDVRSNEQWVENDRLAYYASDHLPAGVEIEVDG